MIISVKDTGRGIKSENISKLFTKFQRLDEDRNTTIEGTGLGLAITKALVDMMGGKINVQSQFGQGSLFIVQIPQKISKLVNPMTEEKAVLKIEQPNSLNDRKADLINNNLNTKKVLIVDDSKLNIKVAKKVLSNFNLQVDECDNGFDCLERVNNGINYDLILMDIMMPEMSGETTLAKLKSNPQFNIPVIALTADAVAGAREKYISEGFTDYLVKPFEVEELLARLNAIIRRTTGNYKEELLEFKDLKINSQKRSITIKNEEITLQGKQFDILEYLVTSKNKILTKEQIFDKVWSFNSFTTTNVVEVYTSELRKTLKKYGYDKYIKTIRGVGYKFEVK